MKNRVLREKLRIKKTIKGTLDRLDRIFKQKEKYLKKYNIISMFLLLHHLSENYAFVRFSDSEIFNFIDTFESRRAANNEKAEDDADFDRELNSYTMHVKDSPDSKEYVRLRHEILLRRFLLEFPELQRKDSQRGFTDEQKQAIYFRCNKKCQGQSDCLTLGKELSWSECQVDHITEHADGGRSTVVNGQILCHDCHQRKSGSSSSVRHRLAKSE